MDITPILRAIICGCVVLPVAGSALQDKRFSIASLVNQQSTSQPSTRPVGRENEDGVLEVLSRDRHLSVFLSLCRLAKIESVLEGARPITVFVAYNSSYDELTPEEMQRLRTPDAAARHVRAHIIWGDIGSGELRAGQFQDLNGDAARIELVDNEFRFQGRFMSSVPRAGWNGSVFYVDWLLGAPVAQR